MHLLFGVIAGDAEGTGHGAAMTTNTERPVDANRSARAVLGDGAGRASHDTRRVFAMHAGGRKVQDGGGGILPLFQQIDSPEGRLTIVRIDIVLVHACYRAGAAANAKIDVQIDRLFHGRLPYTFSTL